MARCDFCNAEIEPGTGKLFIKKDGNTLRFCSHKCQTNMLDLERSGREQKWTDTYHMLKEGGQA